MCSFSGSTARSGQGDTHPWVAAPLLSIHSAGACPWSSLTFSGLSRMISNMLFITCLNQEGTGFVGFEKQTCLWVCFCFIGYTDLNTSNADFRITLKNSYTQEMERIWWLPKYTYPLHKTCVTGRVRQGQKIQGPWKRTQFPLVCKNRGQTKPRTLKVPRRLSGSVNLTPAYSEKQKTATGPVPIQGRFNYSV